MSSVVKTGWLQTSLEDQSEEYKQFVDKFKPKHTTDDCYTPENIYECVLEYCVRRFGVDRGKVVRPFYPGGDYERFQYAADSVVIDNPPFSILSKICKFYKNNGIRFFLFAPGLVTFSSAKGVTALIVATDIIYENGANISTSFVHNFTNGVVAETAPDLLSEIKKENEKNIKKIKKQVPKYKFPDCICTATMMEYMCKYGANYKIRESDSMFIRSIESMRMVGKAIYGSGYLLSEKAAAEKAAAEKAAAEKAAEKAAAEKAVANEWKLSSAELEMQRMLGGAANG